MRKQTKIRIEILSLLNELENPAERIELIESIGKRMRQANSIESAKEVERFTIKMKAKKNIDYSPMLDKK